MLQDVTPDQRRTQQENYIQVWFTLHHLCP